MNTIFSLFFLFCVLSQVHRPRNVWVVGVLQDGL
jgi:hypothetical protein